MGQSTDTKLILWPKGLNNDMELITVIPLVQL
jgi:hypothetical protein